MCDKHQSLSLLLCELQTEGMSQYNKIYSFSTQFRGQEANMVMTSVSGHLLTHEFISGYGGWKSCDPISLFNAPVVKQCPENSVKIKKTLEREVCFNVSKLRYLFIYHSLIDSKFKFELYSGEIMRCANHLDGLRS